VIYLTINAEEKGVTSANVDEMMNSTDPDVKRMLGKSDEMGKLLGIPNDWGVKVIKAVGNYGEIFERNVGPKTPLKQERGLNALWTKGGLIYGIPVR